MMPATARSKFAIAMACVACLVGLMFVSAPASACPIATVSTFNTGFVQQAVVQQVAVPVQTFAVQQVAVPVQQVQTSFAVQQVAVPVQTFSAVSVLGGCVGCNQVQVLGGGGFRTRSVIRQRSVAPRPATFRQRTVIR